MGMHLLRASSGQGVYGSNLPDFMVFLDWKELPWYWLGFDSFVFTVLMIIFIPAFLAFIFGYFSFRSKIKDVYFSIMTQATAYALMLFFFRNETGFGGENGLTDFKEILGFSLYSNNTKLYLYLSTVLAVLIFYLASRYIVQSKVGLILKAIKDSEQRVSFQGYNCLNYKLFIWVFSAIICAVAGALYVTHVGIINPSEMKPSKSIEIAIWVAVGGRGTLAGAMLGSGVVNSLRSICTANFPEVWLLILGSLFITITLWMPSGLVKVFVKRTKKARR